MKAYTEGKLDPRHLCLATDDREANSIVNIGHMDNAVRRAIEEGVDPITAIQMATLNPAEHYGLAHDIGSIAPGRYGDIVILDDLTRMEVSQVFIGGRLVAKNGEMVIDVERFEYPDWVRNTVNINRRFIDRDFYLKYDEYQNGMAKIRVIKAIEGSILTKEVLRDVKIEDGNIYADPKRMFYKLAVIERYTGKGRYSIGFVEGFGWREGAVATSVAHDSHNIIVIGVDEEDMAKAANRVIELNGGIVTAVNGEIVFEIPLPIAGLMSDRPYEDVAKDLDMMYQLWSDMGCKWVSPFMTLSMLALPVIPEIRLTDKGLYSIKERRFLDLIYE